MTYQITSEQLHELAKTTDKVKEMFPDAFKHKSGWYKLPGSTFLMYHDFENGIKYGFGRNGEWYDPLEISWNPSLVPADETEVVNALLSEAIKRGYTKGVNVICLKDGLEYKLRRYDEISRISIELMFLMTKDFWLCGKGVFTSFCIFKNGKWAEIIKEKTVVEELLELLNRCVNYAHIENYDFSKVATFVSHILTNEEYHLLSGQGVYEKARNIINIALKETGESLAVEFAKSCNWHFVLTKRFIEDETQFKKEYFDQLDGKTSKEKTSIIFDKYIK
ncbi:hypothetical protein [Polluticaenibacter yanchengensis]|uniref:DUF4304 domain-containing protein n=1 Tax=Polluticaenibacter yanchengensis TaxID=3014562 RepID=A0ABT4UIW3_9BACT|nr:hypothetical protein [Chitinophagaceae bacterium LY-5]